ncbi:type I pullulanase [Acholeplasma sp. OttesenSCG-928-E16]|nr:type I pullulanase [Acholeplasma sp. OttesenSCG-928-E16]
MKKFLSLLILLLIPVFFTSFFKAEENINNLYIHYFRYSGDYTNWTVWVWQSKPESMEGVSIPLSDDETAAAFNYGAKVAIIPLTDSFADATEVGFIVRRGDWVEKDVDTDRFASIVDSGDGNCHIYLVEGDPLIGTSIDDENGPSRTPKFKTGFFISENEIRFTATESVDPVDLKVYENDVLLSISATSMNTDNKGGVITIDKTLDYEKSYLIEVLFKSDNSTGSYAVTFDGVYDTDGFNNAFQYDKDDLGATVKDGKTTFKLWAPISSAVTLNIYSSGTPASFDGGTDAKLATHLMVKGDSDKGVFSLTLNEDLHGKYYTYDVTNGTKTNKDIVDPYAKSVGINGLRGLIVDFSKTNPSGFQDIELPDNMTNNVDAIIYELHVRDLSIHESWNGSSINRGRYLGLIEENTKYQGVTTGFDHIKELGVTHVQLLPFFDYGNAIDESKQDDSEYNSFNWGYMPLNFNSLEGNYSANPYDGLVRINEFKQVVKAYADAGIRINMDVVYNHTGQSADSNFHLIVPGYYHRLTSSGAFSNGSGTGNETASERSMVRKFIVDSVLFYATEYKLGGFRFDLMALHDIKTMEEIAAKLHEIDDTIMVYGEPWTGGTSTLPVSNQASKSNINKIDGVGAFNDSLRDGVKGSVFDQAGPGFVQGNYSPLNAVKYGITGGITHQDNTGFVAWHQDPNKTINYVTCHDNNTLYDKLYLSLEATEQDLSLIPLLSKQANAYVLLAQGVSFLHAGDEFLRSKPLDDGFDHNSYQSPDSVNQIRWNLKVENKEVNDYYKGLIAFRKAHPSLRMADAQNINDNLRFVYRDTRGFIAYSITNDSSNDPIKTILVLHNSNTSDIKVTLPSGNWNVYVNGTTAGNDIIETVSNEIIIPAHTSYVLGNVDTKVNHSLFPAKATVLDNNNNPNLGLILGLSIGIPVLLGAAVATFFIIKNKKKNALEAK